jgi:hypothetical protein
MQVKQHVTPSPTKSICLRFSAISISHLGHLGAFCLVATSAASYFGTFSLAGTTGVRGGHCIRHQLPEQTPLVAAAEPRIGSGHPNLCGRAGLDPANLLAL